MASADPPVLDRVPSVVPALVVPSFPSRSSEAQPLTPSVIKAAKSEFNNKDLFIGWIYMLCKLSKATAKLSPLVPRLLF